MENEEYYIKIFKSYNLNLFEFIFEILNKKQLEDIDYIRVAFANIANSCMIALINSFEDKENTEKIYKDFIKEGKYMIKLLNKFELKEETINQLKDQGYSEDYIKNAMCLIKDLTNK